MTHAIVQTLAAWESDRTSQELRHKDDFFGETGWFEPTTGNFSSMEPWLYGETQTVGYTPIQVKNLVDKGEAKLSRSLPLIIADFTHSAKGLIVKSSEPKPSDRPWIEAGVEKPVAISMAGTAPA